MNEDLRQLRGKIDGDDQFFEGHQILKIRRRERIVPEWALNDDAVRKLLDQAFPDWRVNKLQRRRASRWMWAIHLYHRLRMPHNQVAEEMSIDYRALVSLLRNIKRASRGLKANGKGPKLGGKGSKTGRPPKRGKK